jgi:hypothetical protein
MFCSNCGEKLDEAVVFCPKCGTKVGGTVSEPIQVTSQTIQAPVEAKTKAKAVLLWLFLGFFGGHCFYIGKKVLGIVHLLIDVGLYVALFSLYEIDLFIFLFVAQVVLWVIGLILVIKYFKNPKLEVTNSGDINKQPPALLKSMIKKALKVAIISYIAVIIVNQFIGMAITVTVTPKPWYERLWITMAGGTVGAGVGAGIGAGIGGIGIALLGTGIGIPGAVALGVLGFIAGSLTGSVGTLIANPEFYDIITIVDSSKLTILIIVAVVVGSITFSILSGIFKRLRTWLAL